jgi:hypothetical protein
MLGGPSVDRVTSQATPSRQTDAMKAPPTAKLYGASRLVAPNDRLLLGFALARALVKTFTRNYSRRALACEAATNAEKICILPPTATAALSL